MARAGSSQEEGRRGHLSFLGGGVPLPASPRGRGSHVPRYRRGGTAFPLATAHREPHSSSPYRAETLFRPYNNSVEIIISRRGAETIELCVEKVLIFISTEYRRKGDWDIATTSSIEMVNDIVRDGL